jgi:hypothetical protein
MSRLEFEGRVEIVGSELDQLIIVGEGSGIHLQFTRLATLRKLQPSWKFLMQHRQAMAIKLDVLRLPIRVSVAQEEVASLHPEQQPNWLARLIGLPYGKLRWQALLKSLLG